MKKYIFNMALMLFLVSVCAAPLWAQMEGTVKGVAKDQAGKPIVGATVLLYDAQTGRKYEHQDQRQGRIYFRSASPSEPTKFTLMQNGNVIDEHNNVPIGAGQERDCRFRPGQGRWRRSGHDGRAAPEDRGRPESRTRRSRA